MLPAVGHIHPGIWISLDFTGVAKTRHITFSLVVISAVYMSPPPQVCMFPRQGFLWFTFLYLPLYLIQCIACSESDW